MSKDELQVNFRMPASLKADLEYLAKRSGRSLTSEVVARLSLSVLGDSSVSEELIEASRAKEMSVIARQSIPSRVRKRILDGINHAVSMGHSSASIDLSDMELDALPRDDAESLIDSLSDWLASAGYDVEWDGPESIWIRFDEL